MSTFDIILIIAAIVVGLAYLARRKARKRRETQMPKR
jgi:cytochrome c oxidase assembly factor CtaG